MTSATFSHATPGRQPLRLSRRRGATPASETARAADQAIKDFKDDRRRRNRGDGADTAAGSAFGRGVDALATGVATTAESLGMPRWIFRGLVLAGVGLVLAAAVANTLPLLARHSISGIATFNGKPLSGATLNFQQMTGVPTADASRVAARTIRTAADGSFQIDAHVGLPSGIYTIAVWPAEFGPTVPKNYRSPESTPLRFDIREDLSGVQVSISDHKQPVRRNRR